MIRYDAPISVNGVTYIVVPSAMYFVVHFFSKSFLDKNMADIQPMCLRFFLQLLVACLCLNAT